MLNWNYGGPVGASLAAPFIQVGSDVKRNLCLAVAKSLGSVPKAPRGR